jgi:nucleoside phosphorylase
MPSGEVSRLRSDPFGELCEAFQYHESIGEENPPKGGRVPRGSAPMPFPELHPFGLLRWPMRPCASGNARMATDVLTAFTVDGEALTVPLARLARMRGEAAVARPGIHRRPVIGLLTALPEEFAAMASLIDGGEEWSVAGDHAEYLCGTMPSASPGRPHPVVLTLLTETGTNWAATAVANMLRSFESVDQVLMVGIAAGVPTPVEPHRHVRLGDVVVATWGIVDYDHVVDRPGGVSLRQGFPQPSALLAHRVKALAAGELQGRRPWEEELAVVLGRLPGFARPDPATDRVYAHDGADASEVRHPDLVASGHREGMPKVHEGRIGSANRSLRNTARRDALARAYDLRAFEMEGSGIGSSAFAGGRDWLVVRGISDYGDHRLGRLWRPYASAVAAAYTRTLLRRCPPITPHGGRVGGSPS